MGWRRRRRRRVGRKLARQRRPKRNRRLVPDRDPQPIHAGGSRIGGLREGRARPGRLAGEVDRGPERRDVGQHVVDPLVPVVARLREGPLDDRDQVGGQAGVERGERFGLLSQDPMHRGGERIGLEGGPAAAQHLVEHHPEGEQVGARVGGHAPYLLGGHVAHGADERPRSREVRPERAREARQAEVEHLHVARGRDEDVGRLDVAVHHAARVGVGQSPARLRHQVDRAEQARRLAAADHPPEVLPLEELHGEVGPPVVLAQVVHGHDIAVGEVAGRAGLGEEALAQDGVVGAGGTDQLDGDHALDERVVRLVHDPHPAFAELVQKLVAADPVHCAFEPEAPCMQGRFRPPRRGVARDLGQVR